MLISKSRLKKYYQEEFPYEYIFKLIKINKNREICFRLNNTIYVRYLTFTTLEEFKNKVIADCPTQIDVGAIYKDVPIKGQDMEVVEKELVFDIDITDYERDCDCKGTKNMCEECFLKIKAAIYILDEILRVDFGFKELTFIFSGGKGVHCWVTDKSAMRLNNIERKAIAGYIKKNRESNIKAFKEKYGEYIVLDVEVTGNMKHLLKMPYSVHTSGRISVPIDIKTLETLKLSDFKYVNE